MADEKKVILLTGASRGIGLSVLQLLSQNDDYFIVAHASRESSFDKAKSLLSPEQLNRIAFQPCDLLDSKAVADYLKLIKKQYGKRLYGLINNAGINVNKPSVSLKEKDFEEILRVNLTVPFLFCKMAIKSFISTGTGVIVNMSSIVGQRGNAGQAPYSASKAGIVALTKTLAQEVGALELNDVRINAIAPGFISTDMSNEIPQDLQDKFKTLISAGRFGQVEEVANLIEYLMSDKSTFINGQVLTIDGGMF